MLFLTKVESGSSESFSLVDLDLWASVSILALPVLCKNPAKYVCPESSPWISAHSQYLIKSLTLPHFPRWYLLFQDYLQQESCQNCLIRISHPDPCPWCFLWVSLYPSPPPPPTCSLPTNLHSSFLFSDLHSVLSWGLFCLIKRVPQLNVSTALFLKN